MVETLIEEVKGKSNCIIKPCTAKYADIPEKFPDDLKKFYSLCGEMILFEDSPYSARIVSFGEIMSANLVILGEEIIHAEIEKGTYESEISKDWYIIADLSNSDYIVIDMNEKRKGRCYRAFWDSYPCRGDTPIIALSFTELIEKLIENNGDYWFFLQENFHSYGDAYDHIEY